MKKIFVICIVILCTAALQTNAQMRDTSNMDMHKVDANSLLQKSKSQKTGAWILLGTGAGLAVAGVSIIGNDAGKDAASDVTTVFLLGFYSPEKTKHHAAGPILAIVGSGAMLGSIPLFIASAKNKGKATLMLKDERVSFNQLINLNDHFVAAGIKINL